MNTSERPFRTGSAPASRVGSQAQNVTLQPSVVNETTDDARSVINDAKKTMRTLASEAGGAAASLSSDLKQAAQATKRAVKEQASEFAADFGHELGVTAEAEKIRGVDAMQGLARAIGTAATELQAQSPSVARYVRDAAQRVEGLSSNIRGRSVAELVQATSDLAKSQPTVFFAGAVAAGFALSRFLKSSASHVDNQTKPNTAVGSNSSYGPNQPSSGQGLSGQARPGSATPGTYGQDRPRSTAPGSY